MIRKSSLALRLVLALAGHALPAGVASAEPRPGHPACDRFRKACIAKVDKLRSTPAFLDHGVVVELDPGDRDYNRCEAAYQEALKSGEWPAYKGHPAVPCEK